MFTLQPLTTAIARGFAHLVDPVWRPSLADLSRLETGLCAAGAWFWGEAAGIALGVALDAGEEASGISRWGEILDLYVQPCYRRGGIGGRLLASLEQTLREKGCSDVRLRHQIHEESPSLVEFLHQQGWVKDPLPYRLFWSDSAMAKADWVQQARLPAGYEVMPWQSLLPAEVERIRQRQAEGGWYPINLSPFSLPPERLEATMSLALRTSGTGPGGITSEVVGWVLVTRQEQQTFCCEILFVSPELQPLGRGIQLLAEAIRRYKHPDVVQSGVPPESVWRVHASNLSMLRFVKRRMTPWITQEGEEWEWVKHLAS